MALAKPEDTLRGFLFAAVLTAVRRQGDEATVRRCIEVAGGDRFPAFFRYPVSSMLRLLYTAACSLSEVHGGFEAALRYLGSRSAPDFLGSPMGWTLLKLSSNEPRRLLSNLPSAYRALMQHGTCSVVWTGPRRGLIRFERNLIPHPYFEGAVQTVFATLEMKNVKVLGRLAGPSDTELEFSWD